MIIIIYMIIILITMKISAGPPSSQQEPSFATLRSLITSRPNPRFFNDDHDCDDHDCADPDYDDHNYDDDHDCDADEHVLTGSLHRWRAQASPGNHLDQVAYDDHDYYDCYDDP